MITFYIFEFSLSLATGTGHLTVGKLYGGILIHDNWRKTKFGQIEELRKQVYFLSYRVSHLIKSIKMDIYLKTY